MAINFDKPIPVGESFQMIGKNGPLDSREVITSLNDMDYFIFYPYIGMIFYSIYEDRYYKVLTTVDGFKDSKTGVITRQDNWGDRIHDYFVGKYEELDFNGKSAYEVAVNEGFVGTVQQWLESLKGTDGKDGTSGSDGKSAYQSAVEKGFIGTETEWLESLKGEDGRNGTNGTDGRNGVDGSDGKSAYQSAVDNGFTGTETEWLESLKGEDGIPSYMWIRYSHEYPTDNEDMKASPDEYIGIYSGIESSAPTDFTEYTWYKIKGDGGGEFTGNENEIVTYDGDTWVKQSGMYTWTNSLNIGFYSEYVKYCPNCTYFYVTSDNYTAPLVINNITVKDVTNASSPSIVYDMATDSSLTADSLKNDTHSYLTVSLPYKCTLTVSDTKSVSLSSLTSSAYLMGRYIGIRASLFNINSLYSISINVGGTDYSKYTLYLRSHDYYYNYMAETRTYGKANNLDYSMPRDSRTINLITGNLPTTYPPNNFNKTIISGTKGVSDNVHFLSLSGEARITANKSTALDLTDDAKLYMHNNANFYMNGATELSLNDYARLYLNGRARFSMNDASEFYMNETARLALNDDSKVYFSGGSLFAMNGAGYVDAYGKSRWRSPELYMNGGCRFSMNADPNNIDNDPFLACNPTQFFYQGIQDTDIWENDNPDSGILTNAPFISVENRAAVLIGGNYGKGSCFIKISPSTTDDLLKLEIFGNSKILLAGNSKTEIQKDSKLILKGSTGDCPWDYNTTTPETIGDDGSMVSLYDNSCLFMRGTGNWNAEDERTWNSNFVFNDPNLTEKPTTVEDISETGWTNFNTNFNKLYTYPYPKNKRYISGGTIVSVKKNTTLGGYDVTLVGFVYGTKPEGWQPNLTKVEGSPFVSIIEDAQINMDSTSELELKDGFKIKGTNVGIEFNDGTNSVTFTIAELQALKALLTP